MRMIARIEPRRSASQTGSTPGSSRVLHERLHAGHGEFLIVRIREVDDLGDEVARRDLVEILFGELEGDRVVGEECRRPRCYRRDLERGIELHSLVAGDVGELEAVDRAWAKS